MKYKASLIQNGRIIREAEFETEGNQDPYREAHDGIDVYRGEWVEIQPAPTIINKRLNGSGDE